MYTLYRNTERQSWEGILLVTNCIWPQRVSGQKPMNGLFEMRVRKIVTTICKTIINALIVIALVMPSAPLLANEGSQSDILHPMLEQVAKEQPDREIRVIVQKLIHDDSLEELTVNLGGEVLRDLSIINAFVATMPARVAPQLAQADGIRWISPDAQVYKQNTSHTQTAPVSQVSVSDGFDVAIYDGSNGSSGWASPWREIGEEDGPETGHIAITRFLAGSAQGVRLQGPNMGIARAVDLVAATEAQLNIQYRRKNFESPSDYVAFEISDDGGVTWSEVGRLEGPATDADLQSVTFGISPRAEEATQIRVVTSDSFGESTRFYLDEVAVTYLAAADVQAELPFKMFVPLFSNEDSEESSPEVEAAALLYATSQNETVRDEFSSISFGGNDGSSVWNGPWEEVGESNGPSSGAVKIVSSSKCQSGNCLVIETDQLGYDLVGRGILREVNLGGATSAVLSFDYRGKGLLSSVSIDLTISNNGGESWYPLQTIPLQSLSESSSSTNIDISQYISGETQIRLVATGIPVIGLGNYFYADNMEIRFNAAGSDDTSKSAGATESVSDEFVSNDFNSNSGSVNWSGNWNEVDPIYGGTGSSYGQVRVRNGALYLDDYPNTGGYPSAARTVDMTGADDATLTFDFSTTRGLDFSDAAVVEVSSDGGQSYTILETFTGLRGRNSGSRSYDISPHISSNTTVRFRVTNLYGGWNEYFVVDNVQIEFGCSSCVDDSNLSNHYNEAIGVSSVWQDYAHIQGDGIGVAVVDSGIANHPDFINPDGSSRIVAQVNFVGGQDAPDDFYGHGTHVAGIIGGDGGQSNGAYIGVAPKANIIDVKVTDDCGAGSTADVVAGLQWILENKDVYNIRIANLSLNSSVAEPYYTSPLNAALEILWFNGIVVVVSAGNNGNDGILYPPANDPFLITVGAVETNDTPSIWDDILALFSASGVTQDGHIKPDLIVPGANIVSALSSDDSNLARSDRTHAVHGADGNYYIRMSGTSMSAGIATGAVALLLQSEPNLTPDQVKYRLMETAYPLYKSRYMNIYNAITVHTTDSANTGLEVNELLWTGSNPVTWGSVNWNSVNWNSVNWNSVNWNSVNWNSINWNSTSWDDPQCGPPNSAPPQSIDVRVSSATDDAEENQTGFIHINSPDLELIYDGEYGNGNQNVGLRFVGVDIPQGATITNAYVQFQVDETDSESTTLTIRGEDTDSAATFTSTYDNISSRPKTSASVQWQPTGWTSIGSADIEQRTSDMKSIIQEIVNRSGWSQGNNLAIVINGSGKRTANSYDGNPSAAPLLHIEFRP